jgi:hypothetical protein
MSLEKQTTPPEAVRLHPELANLVERIVESAITRVEAASLKPFITSRECAELIGITPEHLCAMRARDEGPPWSGAGKWIRYDRRAVLNWLANLPRHPSASAEDASA